MQVGDLVRVRIHSIIDGTPSDTSGQSRWALGLITEDKNYQAGLYRVYVFELKLTMKHFISDLSLVEDDKDE